MVTGLLTLIDSVRGFVTALQKPDPAAALPAVEVSLAEDGTVTMTASVKPSEVRVWHAESLPSSPLGRRDFRMIKGHTPAGPCIPPAILLEDICVNPIIWASKKTDAVQRADGRWEASTVAAKPAAEGVFAGYFLEMKFAAKPKDLVFTSQVGMQPMAYPYEGCKTEEQCLGELV